MSKNSLDLIQSKIFNSESILDQVQQWKSEGFKIVFTNGCFDLLHLGHVHYLAQAATLGDKLILGLNSDASIKRLKGASRPIKDLENRQYILAGLQSIDAVVPFDSDTPFDLIKSILPDFLVKGGDWRPDQIVGGDFVLANGGVVKSLPFIEGHSTTSLVKKITDSQ